MEAQGTIWCNLPLEIWDHIMSYMNTDDLANYCLVSKAWYSICAPYLYQSIMIEDPDDLAVVLCNSPRAPGRHVKKIVLDYEGMSLEETYDQLRMLIDYCPNVEVFTSDEILTFLWWNSFLKVLQDGHVWRKIQKIPETIRESDNMDLYYQCSRHLRQSLQTIQLLGPRFGPVRDTDVCWLGDFPCLNSLEVYPRIGFATVQDFELLLKYTQHLRQLTVDWHDFGLSQAELEWLEATQARQMPRIDIYPSMECLRVTGCFSFDSVYMPQLCYFLQKFPRLKTAQLTIHSANMFDNIFTQYISRTPHVVIKVRYATILLQVLSTFVGLEYQKVLELEYAPEFHYLRQMVVRLKMTKNEVHCSIIGELEDDFLSSVSIDILQTIGFRIHHLTIEHPFRIWQGFNLGIYGDLCPRLQTLEVSYVEVEQFALDVLEEHRELRHIKLIDSVINNDAIFSALSTLVPNLETLVLENCTFFRERAFPFTLVMDMPHTRFSHHLHIDLTNVDFEKILLRLSIGTKRSNYYLCQDNGTIQVPNFVVQELYANYHPYVATLFIRCQSLRRLELTLPDEEKNIVCYF
ncbi:hypothetical protein CU097_008323 [Rhizopus azygosporus]|uniref:F-box domain-containing protein n=1 Tax=Rhizopus azygosporus TaxID=86630 RepID=A0A367JPI6_RHIAZ|nr:hypothetical protein CU097_008323 [Rhizopus azygosporus]